MRYCRFEWNGEAHYGMVESVAGRDSILRILLTAPEDANGDVEGLRTRRIAPIALGHEVPKEPLLFLKAPSALLAPGGVVKRPKLSQRVDYEGELGVVIGRRCHQPAAEEDVRAYILGYTCVNDVTARDLQNKDGQWSRAKGFDTFCPVGPVVVDGLDPWTGLGVETRVNGEVRQQGNTRDFIFTLDAIIRHIAQAMTLYPGDLIATGTPAGVGPVCAGEVMEVSVEGVGKLRNPVADE
jgi:2-keto-4-pentenoate hydratase/2-oxohepta-3-ene-1,7-dioic acid hydratase in catechol pathway